MNILAQGEARLRLSACATQNSGCHGAIPSVQTPLKQSRERQQHPRAQESFCAPKTILGALIVLPAHKGLQWRCLEMTDHWAIKKPTVGKGAVSFPADCVNQGLMQLSISHRTSPWKQLNIVQSVEHCSSSRLCQGADKQLQIPGSSSCFYWLWELIHLTTGTTSGTAQPQWEDTEPGHKIPQQNLLWPLWYVPSVPTAYPTASPRPITAHISKKPHRTQGTQTMPNYSGSAFAQAGLTNPPSPPPRDTLGSFYTWTQKFHPSEIPNPLWNAELCCSAQGLWNCYISIFNGADRNSCLDPTKKNF